MSENTTTVIIFVLGQCVADLYRSSYLNFNIFKRVISWFPEAHTSATTGCCGFLRPAGDKHPHPLLQYSNSLQENSQKPITLKKSCDQRYEMNLYLFPSIGLHYSVLQTPYSLRDRDANFSARESYVLLPRGDNFSAERDDSRRYWNSRRTCYEDVL